MKLTVRSLLLLDILLVVGCAAKEKAESDLPAVSVEAVTAQRTTLRPVLEVDGTIVAIPERTAAISPREPGWVDRVAVVEGQHTRAGDVLIVLDKRVASVELKRAKAALEEKRAALALLKRGHLPRELEVGRQERDKARAAANGVRTELSAMEKLLQAHELSQVSYDMKHQALKAAEADLASAEARLKLLQEGTRVEMLDQAQALVDVAEADWKRAELALDWCTMRTPINGIVVQLLVHQGQFLDRAAPVATVIDLEQVFAQAQIPSSDSNKIRPKMPIVVELTSVPGRQFPGTLERISAEADLITGNLKIFANIPNKDSLLRPGLGCRARISLPEIADVVAVPVEAVADNSGTSVVTLIRNGRAHETRVVLGEQAQGLVHVKTGVAAGDLVAKVGGYSLPDGCRVHIISGKMRER